MNWENKEMKTYIFFRLCFLIYLIFSFQADDETTNAFLWYLVYAEKQSKFPFVVQFDWLNSLFEWTIDTRTQELRACPLQATKGTDKNRSLPLFLNYPFH